MEEKSSSNFETVVAILIAITTVLGAVVAWRASVVDDASGDADFAGLQATTNAEETRALNFVNTYENYGTYTTYKRYSTLGDLIAEDAANASEADAEVLDGQRANAHDLALANQGLFPNKYLDRDGSYNVQRQLGEMWADAAKKKDLYPAPQFAEADKLRVKTNRLLQSLMIIALALVFYTGTELVDNERAKYAIVGLATLITVGGVVMAILIDISK